MNSWALAALAAASTSSIGGVGPAVGDVVADRDREEERLVLDDADRGAQRAERHVAHVVAVDLDGPAGHVVEPREEPGDRRLARAGLARRSRPTRRAATSKLRSSRIVGARAVREGDVAEAHAALGDVEVDGAGALDDLGRARRGSRRSARRSPWRAGPS